MAEWLVEQWSARFTETLLSMGDLKASLRAQTADPFDVQDTLLWWEQPFSCASDAPIWIGTPADAWKHIGESVLAAAGVENGSQTQIQTSYLEIVRQSMSSLAQNLGQHLSSPVTCMNGQEAAPGPSLDCNKVKIQIDLPNKSLHLILAVAANFPNSAHPPVTPAAPSGGSRSFELLLDVEMPVSVSFGRANIKLHDALKLITGSLVELDRGLNDPVELLANNCVIARGDVVVIDGNYGIRITEIVSQRQRLQQSRRYMLQ